MRYSLLLGAILCSLSFYLLGCGEDTERRTTETPEAGVIELNTAEQVPLTPESVFKKLWNQFNGDFGDNEDNLQGLREVTTSPTYLAYLAAVFPTEKRVQTLEEYFQVASPDPERYTPFLQGFVGKVGEEDIIFIHRFVSSQREAEAMFFAPGNLVEDIDGFVLFFRKSMAFMTDPATENFKRRHNLAEGTWITPLREFHNTIAKEDIAWLQEQMTAHGTDTGLVWSAIYRPALIGEILLYFETLDHLRAWMAFKTGERF